MGDDSSQNAGSVSGNSREPKILDKDMFAKEVQRQRDSGFGFIPLLGSGISLKSGIPVTSEFKGYFGQVLLKCFGVSYTLNAVSESSFWGGNLDDDKMPLDLLAEGWPSFNSEPLDKVNDFIKDLRTAIYRGTIEWKFRGCGGKDSYFCAEYKRLLTEGLSTFDQDWVQNLTFLSRLRLVTNPDTEVRIRLSSQNHAIIDAFNSFIARDRRPNLAHKMLAHLARPLRMHVFLTTNFDELLEQALLKVGQVYTQLNVSSRGGLPDPSIVQKQDCLIKLHGTLFETRADLSIFGSPGQEDIDKFSQYFYPVSARGTGGNSTPKEELMRANHLLVLGYSGGDERVRHMIGHLIRTRGDSFRIFWICHGKGGSERVREIFTEFAGNDRLNEIFTFVETQRTDLLLYELYQLVTNSLPPGGLEFEFSHFIPPHASSVIKEPEICQFVADFDAVLKELNDSKAEVLEERIISLPADSKPPERTWMYQIVRARRTKGKGGRVFLNGRRGLSSLASEAFLRNEDHLEKLWFELGDYVNFDDLWSNVLRAVADQLGILRLDPIDFSCPPTDQASQDLLRAHLQVDRRRWLIFFTARTPPGINSGFWPRLWDEDDFRKFDDFLLLLESWDFVCCYLTRPRYRSEFLNGFETWLGESPVREDWLRWTNGGDRHGPNGSEPFEPDKKDPSDWARGEVQNEAFQGCATPDDKAASSMILRRTLSWICSGSQVEGGTMPPGLGDEELFDLWLIQIVETDPDWREHFLRRLHFTFALTLFRHSRHVSACASSACFDIPGKFSISSDPRPNTTVEEVRENPYASWAEEYCKCLAECGVIRKKYGHFVWIHWDLKERLRSLLFRFENAITNKRKNVLNGFTLKERLPKVHHEIGMWYFQAFQASLHPHPLFECIYHHFQCALHSGNFGHSRLLGVLKPEFKLKRSIDREGWIRVSLIQIARILRQGEGSLRLWLAPIENIESTLDKIKEVIFPERDGGVENSALFGVWKDVELSFNLANNLIHQDRAKKYCVFLKNVGTPSDSSRLAEEEGEVVFERREDFLKRVERLRNEIGNILGKGFCLGEQGNEGMNAQACSKLICVEYEMERESMESEIAAVAGADEWARKVPYSGLVRPILESWFFQNSPDASQMRRMLRVLKGVCDLLMERAWRWQHILIGLHEDWGEVSDRDVIKEWIKNREFSHLYLLGSQDGEPVARYDVSLWRHICAISETAIELCKMLPPADLDDHFYSWANIRFRTIYGHALGKLVRPREAHNQLDQARAFLGIDRARRFEQQEWALIALRRAEVFYTLFRFHRFSAEEIAKLEGEALRRALADLDEAWNCIRYALNRFGDWERSATLWGRLYLLQLKVLSEYARLKAYLPCEFRHAVAPKNLNHADVCPELLISILNKALLLPNYEPFERVRFCYYFLRGSAFLRSYRRWAHDWSNAEKIISMTLDQYRIPKNTAQEGYSDLLERAFASFVGFRKKNFGNEECFLSSGI